MRSIASLSARFQVLVLGVAVAIMVLGFIQLPNASVDALPEFTPPYVEVQTEALGLSAEEVEQLITVPLEADLLNGVAWLDSIESESVQGLSSIVLNFEPGTDPIRARQMVAERLTQAHALPNVSRPPVMLQPLSSANRLAMVSLSSDDLSLVEMSVLARWTIKPRLLGVSGVANVSIWGQRERQLQVLVDPERLQRAGVSLDDIIQTTGNALWVSPLTFLEASTPGTGGFIDTPNQRLSVQHIFPINTADDLAAVAIEAADANLRHLRLGDVADVVEDHQPLIGDAIVNDAPGLILVVEKFPEANTVEVTAGVEEALAALAPGLSGVQVDSTVFRPATFIESAVANLTLVVLIGLVLVAVIIAGLFVDWRAAVVSLVTIPLALVAAALVLHLLGATINAMVVVGFVATITIIVDDAVIGTTEIMRRVRAAGADQEQRRTGAIQAVLSVRGPMVYATLAIVLAIGPLLLVGEVTGALLPSLLAAYLTALVASMLVSLTVTPALATMLVGRHGMEWREPRLISWLQGRYVAALSRMVNRPRPAIVAAGAVAIGVVVLFAVSMAPGLGRSGLPAFQDRDLLIHWDGAPGTSHTEMNRIVAAASTELRGLNGVRGVGAHVGRAVASDQVVAINSGEIWLSIAPDADYDTTLASIQGVVDGYPGLRREVLTYPAERIDQILSPGGDDVVVRIFGQDLDLMRAKAAELRDLMAGIDGISGVSVEPQLDEPTLEIEVDVAAAGSYGLKPGDVRRVAATLLSGIEVGSLFEAQKVFEVVVWGTPNIRSSVSAVEDLLIETPDHRLVALGDLADVRIAPSPTVIRRDAVQRAIDIGGTISGRDVGTVLGELESAIGSVEFPLETHAEVLGDTAERQAAQVALLAVAAASLIGILLLLQAAFSSWRLAFLFFLTLPATLAGGVLVALAIGGLGSLGAVIGMLSVLALAIRHGILFIDRCRQLERDAAEQFGPGLVLRTAGERLSPMLVTALATAGALLPFAVLGGAGLEVIHPMSLVILGGLVSSVLINLFVVPSLYLPSGMSPQLEAIPMAIEQAREPQVIGAG
jgi:Cu/Ag efflux pump CusA